MFFILQKENKFDTDILILKNILDKNKFIHNYNIVSLDFFNSDNIDDYDISLKEAIPVGTIQFVSRWLEIFHGVSEAIPIEIPPCLRTEYFLKRKYSIRTKEDIPQQGYYFIKDASQLKVFSFNGELSLFIYPEIWTKSENEFDNSLRLNPNHLYQVSEVVDILSEYRVYIINGNIENIVHYNGDPTIFPDVKLIEEANLLYSREKDYPKSYSMDVMVTPKGTALIEIHYFSSLGLYSTLFGDNLAYAYRDGIDYLINHNTKQTVFSNF